MVKYLTYVIVFSAIYMLTYCGNSTNLLGQGEAVYSNDSLQQSSTELPNLKMGTVFAVNNSAAGESMGVLCSTSNTSAFTIGQPAILGVFLKNSSGVETLLKSISTGAGAPYSTVQENFTLVLPSSTVAGVYSLVFRADASFSLQESNEADNEFHHPFTVTSRPELTDLVAQLIHHDRSHGVGTLKFRILNLGAVTLNEEPVAYRIYLSTNNTILEKSSDIMLETAVFSQAIEAGNYHEILYQNSLLEAPGGVSISLFVEVDYNERIPEENEINNIDNLTSLN